MNAKRKELLAVGLSIAIGSDFVVKFAPSYKNDREDTPEGNPSLGHIWYAEFFDGHSVEEDPNRIWMDDRKGCIVTQLMDSLQEKARMYVAISRIIEHRQELEDLRPKAKAGVA